MARGHTDLKRQSRSKDDLASNCFGRLPSAATGRVRKTNRTVCRTAARQYLSTMPRVRPALVGKISPRLALIADNENVNPWRRSPSGPCLPKRRLERAESEHLELSNNRCIRPLEKHNEHSRFVCYTTVHELRRQRSGNTLNPQCIGFRGAKRLVWGLAAWVLAWFYSLSPLWAAIRHFWLLENDLLRKKSSLFCLAGEHDPRHWQRWNWR